MKLNSYWSCDNILLVLSHAKKSANHRVIDTATLDIHGQPHDRSSRKICYKWNCSLFVSL